MTKIAAKPLLRIIILVLVNDFPRIVQQSDHFRQRIMERIKHYNIAQPVTIHVLNDHLFGDRHLLGQGVGGGGNFFRALKHDSAVNRSGDSGFSSPFLLIYTSILLFTLVIPPSTLLRLRAAITP